MNYFTKEFEFGSKAETLENLSAAISESVIPDFVHFNLMEWKSSRELVLENINKMVKKGRNVIVRSSSLQEDGELFAQAGKFLSIPHISPLDKESLSDAIDQVFNSYCEDNNVANDKNQVLVQEMVTNVSMSGVVFTHVLSTGAPYYVINYDDETGSTDSITLGVGYSNRTIYILRKYWEEINSQRFYSLLKAINEIEKITGNECLDIEFAINKDLQVKIFQVRRITTSPNWGRGLGIHIEDAVSRLKASISDELLFSEDGELRESGTVFGNMPDWNPAEIIGTAPKKLAASMYRSVITDSIWRKARAEMGYYEPQGLPLMRLFAGQPYINTRISFSSFIPASLNKSLLDKLTIHWVKQLAENPHLHDKVEFSIALTTWSFDFKEKAKKLLPSSLDQKEYKEIENSYLTLTQNLVNGDQASIEEQIQMLKILEKKHSLVIENLDKPSLKSISKLHEDVTKYGTLPFSILARHAFIAKTLLESLVSLKVIKDSDLEKFYQSINTVASNFIEDLDLLMSGQILESEFNKVYGHLRPGTYDVLSTRYDKRKELLSYSDRKNESKKKISFSFKKTQIETINKLLLENGFSINCEIFFKYCEQAIQGRELAKLIFTRSISDILEILTAWAECNGLSRIEISHLSILEILNCMVETRGRTVEDHLRSLSIEGQREYSITSSIKLPYLITRPSDLSIVPILPESPNFITMQKILAPIKVLSCYEIDKTKLENCIVVIESADPGFDWIFTQKIAGLITKYGGANSHMAIRCAEFNIAAAIGCGEQIFERVLNSKIVELDCSGGKIEIDNY
tara:strand:- start:10616 stop:13021 length:2406 start_codon:yes stop_codon:yes gene_type:complete